MSTAADNRFIAAFGEGARSGLKTAVWLLSIMVPISFGVFLLDWFGGLEVVSRALSPVMEALDLPGSAALVYVSSMLINLYSAIAVMGNLDLSPASVTTLALMTLIAHNFLIELAVMRTTGSNPLRMFLLRVVASLVAAWALSVLLPASMRESVVTVTPPIETVMSRTFAAAAVGWLESTGLLIGRVTLIVLALMIGERLLQALGVIRWLGDKLRPLMVVFGLPRETAFLWLVSNTLGLGYGAGVLRKEVTEGRLSQANGDLLNHHMAVSHSLLEDTLLFVALGVPAVWIVVPRVILAVAAVWLRRAELSARRRFAT